MKKAYIIGISGQDGSLMADLLHRKGYQVAGCCRNERQASAYLREKAKVNRVDLNVDIKKIVHRIARFCPNEIYNFAGVTELETSLDFPAYTMNVNAYVIMEMIEKLSQIRKFARHQIKFCLANSCEIFGDHPGPHTELTPLSPQSPYATAKAALLEMSRHYRRKGIFVSNAILHNHESHARRKGVVYRVTSFAKAYAASSLTLGNVDTCRDWGYAQDYMDAMWLMNQHDSPDDYVVASGVSHSVKEMCTMAMRQRDIEMEWTTGPEIFAYDKRTGYKVFVSDPGRSRPGDVPKRSGNISKIQKALGWSPQMTFSEMIRLLVSGESA